MWNYFQIWFVYVWNSLIFAKNSNMKFRIDIQESVNEGKFPKILETISPIFTKISNVSFKESSLSKRKARNWIKKRINDESIFFLFEIFCINSIDCIIYIFFRKIYKQGLLFLFNIHSLKIYLDILYFLNFLLVELDK